jgi:hypothetical protein
VPAVQARIIPGGGGNNPQVRLSGLAQGPFPAIVFDDDMPRVGGPTNCNLRFGQNSVGPFTPASVQAAKSYLLTGVTRDGSGNVVGSVPVDVYRTADKQWVGSVVSDAVTGVYTFGVRDPANQYFCVGYLPGSPDLAGTTVNNLTGV